MTYLLRCVGALALLTAGCSGTGRVAAPLAIDTRLNVPVKLPLDAERVINMEAGELVTATINGQPMKLLMDPEYSYTMVLNAASAARAGLIGSKLRPMWIVGGVWVKGYSSQSEVTIGHVKLRRNVIWLERNVISGEADGIISPDMLPENRVTLRLHPDVGRERSIELPVENGGLQYHRIKLGSEILFLTFSPYRPLSLASAAAGAHIATMQDGYWTGDVRPIVIRASVERPGRAMALRRPVELDGLQSKSFLVRTADFRGRFQLPPDEKTDPAEIVVTGKTSKGRASFLLFLGMDTLGACSSITHDKTRRTMTLRCL